MKETVLITGANSFIAQHLIPLLQPNYNLKFLTRTPKSLNEYKWDTQTRLIDEEALDEVDYIIHLAGAKLNDGTPLTEERKQLIYESRIGAADLLREKLIERKQPIKSFISASAIGYYGFQDDTLTIDETGKKGIGFAADLSADWEKAADRFKADGVADTVAKIRVSLVLGNEGGIFPIYSAQLVQNPNVLTQPNPHAVPWNHVEDMAGIFAFALANKLDGVYNSVAPNPVTQQTIFQVMANELIGEQKYQIHPFKGQHLVSTKIVAAGYQFKYPTIEMAIHQLISESK